MSLEDNKALVQRAADLFDGYETDAFDQVYSPELAEAFRSILLTMPFGKHIFGLPTWWPRATRWR